MRRTRSDSVVVEREHNNGGLTRRRTKMEKKRRTSYKSYIVSLRNFTFSPAFRGHPGAHDSSRSGMYYTGDGCNGRLEWKIKRDGTYTVRSV